MKRLYAFAFAFLGMNMAFAETLPSWVQNPYKDFCSEKELCAVGEGEGLSMASLDARSGISKIFETKIDSSFSLSVSQENGEVRDFTSEHIDETSNQLLNAVEIKASFIGKTAVYALASLDKETARKILFEKIQHQDEKMKASYKRSTLSSANQAMALFEKRKELTQKYILLTGEKLPSPLSYGMLYNNLLSKRKKAVFSLEVDTKVKGFKNSISTAFLEKGFSFKKDAPKLLASLHYQEVPIAVKGFKKFLFYLEIKQEKDGKNVLLHSADFEVIEPSLLHAEQTVLEDIKENLLEKLDTLNL